MLNREEPKAPPVVVAVVAGAAVGVVRPNVGVVVDGVEVMLLPKPNGVVAAGAAAVYYKL